MATFFTGWALWQKMVFILACCLVVTIIAGLLKLWYTVYRKRRYAALEKLADTVQVIREKSIIRSLSTKKPKGPRKKSVRQANPPPMPSMVEIPFGIRALEEGTQIEDVWDSRPNSRETSRVDLYRQSNTSTTDLGRSQSNRLGQRDVSGLTISTDTSTIGSGGQDHTPQSPDRDTSARNRYPPHSFARYEGTRNHKTTNSFSRRRGEGPRGPNGNHPPFGLVMESTNAMPDGPQSSQSASTFLSTTSSNPGSDSENGTPEYQMRLNSRSRRSQPSSVRSSSADSIRAMQQRRQSQCAETGQILPRLKSEDLGSEGGTDMPLGGMSRHERRMSFEMSESGEDSDSKHFNTPSIRVTANTPDPGDKPPGKRERKGRKLRKRSTPASTPPATPTTPTSSSFSISGRRSSDALRQINPGFAVLKPGSLETSPVRTPSGDETRHRSASEESVFRKGRRLQKRTSEDSQGPDRGRSQ